MNEKCIGFFSENELSMADNGSIYDYLSDNINYDKQTVIEYLDKGKKTAVCPKITYDIISNRQIATCFYVYTDGEFIWKSDLKYYVEHYNIVLPNDFLKKITE